MAGEKKTGIGSGFYVASAGVGGTFSAEGKLANLTKIGALSISTDTVETTDLDSGKYREFITTLMDSGELEIEGNLVIGGTAYSVLKALQVSGAGTSFFFTSVHVLPSRISSFCGCTSVHVLPSNISSFGILIIILSMQVVDKEKWKYINDNYILIVIL